MYGVCITHKKVFRFNVEFMPYHFLPHIFLPFVFFHLCIVLFMSSRERCALNLPEFQVVLFIRVAPSIYCSIFNFARPLREIFE